MTVKQVQLLLAFLGYDPGDCDGVDGKNTRAALRAFQQAEGLDPDGIAGQQTQARLREAVFQGRTKTGQEPAAAPLGTGTWWDEIRYFTREEFRCKCGGKYCNGYPVDIDMNMVKIADEIRNRIGKPIQINSGIRCKTHNANVGGVSNSQHLLGNAADLGCPIGCTPSQMASIADEPILPIPIPAPITAILAPIHAPIFARAAPAAACAKINPNIVVSFF